jgi:hypothetical protein
MELNVRKEEKLFLIVAIVGFFAFFLPWIRIFFGSFSAYDVLSFGIRNDEFRAFFLILLPCSFVFSALSKLGYVKNPNPTFLKFVEFIPINMIFGVFIILLFPDGIYNKPIQLESDLFRVLDIGFYLTVISSIIIVFAPFAIDPNKRANVVQSEPKTEMKSKIDYEKVVNEIVKTSTEFVQKITTNIDLLSVKVKGLKASLESDPNKAVVYVIMLLLVIIFMMFIMLIA